VSDYVTRAGDAKADRDVVIDIWRGHLGHEARLAPKYDWFYLGCPWGAPEVQLLRHQPSESWVGVAAAGPRRMVWRGRELSAGVLVDLAVTTEHRSLGPALTLQKALLAAGRARFDLLYGFPNPKAAAVFKRVGYAPFGEIVRYVRVLRHRKHVEKVLPGRVPRLAALPAGLLLDALPVLRAIPALRRLSTCWRASVDPRMDRLWASSDHGDAPIAIRDTTFLSWRFDRGAVARTEYLLVSERGSPDLRAWFACEADAAGVLHVRDFWSSDAARGIDRAVVDALLLAASLRGHASVSFEYAGPSERLAGFRAAGFGERSRRPVFGRWSEGEGAPLHLTAADEDE
jgi:hypothetical protein